MGHLPVIADVTRCTLLWDRQNGVMPRNVLHVRRPFITDASVLAAFEAALSNGMFDCMPTSYTLKTIAFLNLDGSSSTFFGDVTPRHGNGSPPEFIPQSAGIVSLHTALRGQSHRGRVYVGPVCEGDQANGVLSAVATMTTAWANFRDTLFSSHGVHLAVASYKHSSSEDVTDIVVRSIVGTQRRRADQLR